MRDFVITADSNCDLLPDYIKEKKIGIIPHYYDLEGITYGDEINLTPKEFYDKMRGGLMPTTMASNPAVIRETFQKYADQGLDVLHISFSSALSGGHSNVVTGAREISEENPGVKIVVLDSLNVSMGEGMVVMKAVQLKEQGKTLEEIAEWIEANKLNFCVQFTVNDLFHLQRGGRVSKMTAIVGSIINIKPMLIVNKEGALVSSGTARGRKKSLTTIVDNMEKQMGKYKEEDNVICVVHGDALEDAQYIVKLIKERLHTDNVIVNTVSPSIGAHSGPGAVGICFMGETRE
ncbi:DegV family protein [Anaerocolumna aminovalerica]|jgi:DegV family protein with EDD domain|uniref:EDD domain protein, DegV family n=1 Tax=Anaerocolumna aminovalerica TaxID=1527 RepID=A0A1I5GFP7_9FIRM|nr:DegV family protein [Anaerocolumna aminovalerica]MDU6264564.1 DegV family protein [Anaerocolumna aminovalerica]SFO34878.1 EDD domain protein, DegV family [Anaerocolumna aminovalerica]